MNRGLLGVIESYDIKQRAYIAELEAENDQLTEKNNELANQLFSYVQTVDRMKLELIMAGALVVPKKTKAA
jgi:cell division protein FtsB